MRSIAILISCIVALIVHAQDFVIGGQAEPSANSEKYDSLKNFYLGQEDAKMMIGQEFTYYNTIDYSSGLQAIPYPWKDGRLRAGRYTSSQTAKDAYLSELKKKSGTKYVLTDFVKYEGSYGYIFTDKKGESIFYAKSPALNYEFVCEGYKEKFRKTYVGKEVYCLTEKEGKKWNPKDARAVAMINGYFIGLKSREIRTALPYMSKWIISGLGVDTTYWGDHTRLNDMDNMYCRLAFVVHNDELGDYECFVEGSHMLGTVQYVGITPKFTLVKSLKEKPFTWGKNISTKTWEGEIPSDILLLAKNGDPNASYAIINYYNDYGRFDQINNVSYEEYVELLKKAVNGGYIHNRTQDWLLKVAHHYIPYIIEDEFDEKNNYEKGVPYLIESARLGNQDALSILVECLEKGKSQDNSAYTLIEEKAKDSNIACLFLGRRLLKGDPVTNLEKIIVWLQQIANGNSGDKGEASIILSDCYKQGIGTPKDTNKSLDLLIQAADNNNQKACLELGEIFYNGKGTSKDLDKAAQYLQKGIKLEKHSAGNIDYEYYFMLGKILASKSDVDCITYFLSALHSNNPKRYDAAIELGNLFYEGKIVKKNEGEAAEYYWKAYKNGKLEEGKRLFEKYQLKDKLIDYLNEQRSEGNRTDNYVDDIIQSLNK